MLRARNSVCVAAQMKILIIITVTREKTYIFIPYIFLASDNKYYYNMNADPFLLDIIQALDEFIQRSFYYNYVHF